MVLDKGFCSIYSVSNTAAAGDMPNNAPLLKHQSWYGELSFETAPQPIAGQEGVGVSERIRILQNRAISNHDIAILSSILPPPAGSPQYDIVRAFHGVDDDSGELISDLSLERLVQDYDID
ncbi:MAG: hypothetical protein AAGU74_14010 [Bacillota bacterium]